MFKIFARLDALESKVSHLEFMYERERRQRRDLAARHEALLKELKLIDQHVLASWRVRPSHESGDAHG